MRRFGMIKWVTGAALALFVAGSANAVIVQAQAPSTPKGFNYEIRDGNWREEVRQGQCTTVKVKSASGDYSETRKCD
jgi:hypothetical protein